MSRAIPLNTYYCTSCKKQQDEIDRLKAELAKLLALCADKSDEIVRLRRDVIAPTVDDLTLMINDLQFSEHYAEADALRIVADRIVRDAAGRGEGKHD